MPKRSSVAAAAVLLVGALGLAGGLPPRSARAVAAGGDRVLMAAGDIGDCLKPYDEATAELVKHQVAADPTTTVAMLGDGAYPQGDATGYSQCYDPSWGAFKANTKPAPGNHDYAASTDRKSAPGYFGYFGAAAGDPSQAFYSYDLGAWHIVSLNSTCGVPGAGCTPGSPQLQWLETDLAAHPGACLLAYWHHPRFFSVEKAAPAGTTPSSDITMSAIWDVLQAHGADVVLNAHIHHFESFPRQNSTGALDPNGMREFIVGTGGGHPDAFNPSLIDTHSEYRHDGTFGAIKLTLHDGSYDWAYLATGADPAGTVVDSGHDTCTPSTPTTTPTPASTGPGPATTSTMVVHPPVPCCSPTRSGYWMVGADGAVYPFGNARKFGDAAIPAGSQAVDLEPTPSGNGYWIVDDHGRVGVFGDAVGHGDADPARLAPGETVTSLSATPDGAGYWIFTSRGRVLSFGNAVSFGDMSATRLNGPVLDSIPTPSGRGYYMVASDGGIFAFGDARFFGSMGGSRLNAPVQSLVPDGDGAGYWLVASDGGIFAFDAPFKGSMGGTRLNRPVTGMVRFGDGYLMVGEDGGVFDFSSQPFSGSLGGRPPARPIVSVAALVG